MNTKVRALLSLIAFSTTLVLAGCGHYKCGATFGGGTCNSTGTGGGGGGGGVNPPAQAFVYYVNQGSMSGKEVIIPNGATSLAAIPNFSNPVIPTAYTIAGEIIAQKKFVYVPFGSTQQLFAYSIDIAGNLAPLAGSPFPAAYASGMANAGQPLISVITNPAGTVLYIADAATSTIHVFSINSTSGVPTELQAFSTAGVVIPWNLAIDGLGRFLYVTEGNSFGEGQSQAVFNVAANGTLSGGTVLNLGAGVNMWEFQCDPTGNFAIGVTGETGFAPDTLLDDHIYVFRIGSAGGLTLVGAPVVTANAPTAVRIHPSGKFVYDFSVNRTTAFDGPLEGFQMDTNGNLTKLSGSPFATLSIPYGGYFNQTGNYMVFHEHGTLGVYNIDTATGIPTENAPLVTGVGDLPFAVTDPQ